MKKNWEIKKLGSVAKVIYGYTEKASSEKIGPKFLRITDIQESGVDWETVPYCKINETDFEKYKLSTGDIVFARTGATTGKSYLLSNPPKSVFASYLIKVHINNRKLSSEYLFNFFQTKTYWDKINAGVSGSAQGGFNATKLSELEIPIPPLPEQQLIVSILNEAFTAIDKAKENVQRNLQNAKELFQSELNRIFTKKGDDWEIKKLGDVSLVIAGQSPEGKYYNENGNGLPFYQGKKKFTEKYIGEPTTWTTAITKEAEEGDILMSVRAPVGPINFANQKICIGRGLAAIRAGKLIEKEFLFNFLLKQENEIVGNTGAVFNSINKTQIENILIAIPSLKEQQQIVNQLDTLSTETKNLENIYQQKLNALEELKKSILQKAFSGELTKTQTEVPA